MTQQRKRLVVVLGMHRSGTSAITRGLQTMGVALGNDLMPATSFNATGYFENVAFNRLNIKLLDTLGWDWRTLDLVQPHHVRLLNSNGLFLQAVELLYGLTDGSSIFGLKDPRLSLLLNFWRPVFEHCQLDVSYVVAFRNPADVAASLLARDEIAESLAYAMWELNSSTALDETESCDRVVVDYDSLLLQPKEILIKVARRLNLQIHQQDLEFYASSFINSSLRHHCTRKTPDEYPRVVFDLHGKLLGLSIRAS